MSVQTSISLEPSFGAAGLEYDNEYSDTVSKVATEAIPFGAFVVLVGETCKLPAATGDVTGAPGGFALLGPTMSTNPTNGIQGYAIGDLVPVLRRGRVWIVAETAIAAHAQPFVRHAGTGTRGSLGNTADTANATLVPNARMFTASSGVGALAVVEIVNP